MTNCIPLNYQFSKVKNRTIEINFTGGDISSDGGVLLLREADNSYHKKVKLLLSFDLMMLLAAELRGI